MYANGKFNKLVQIKTKEYIRNTVKYAIENDYINCFVDMYVLIAEIREMLLSAPIENIEIWEVAFDIIDKKLKEFGIEFSEEPSLRYLQLGFAVEEMSKFIIEEKAEKLANMALDLNLYPENKIPFYTVFKFILEYNSLESISEKYDIPLEKVRELETMSRQIEIDYSSFKPHFLK